jgi:hypothetical protein
MADASARATSAQRPSSEKCMYSINRYERKGNIVSGSRARDLLRELSTSKA